MIDNADKLSVELDVLIENLQKYQSALKDKNESQLEYLLEEGNLLKLEIDSRKNKWD